MDTVAIFDALRNFFSVILAFLAFLVKPALIFIVCRIAMSLIMKITANAMAKSKLDIGIQGFVKSAVKILLWALTLIIIAESFGVNTASLVALLSVAALALSLAVQGLFTNVFSGITILMTKPFVIGDYVDVAGVQGVVTKISLLRTTLLTPDNKVELIPNGDIAAKNIINYSTEPQRRVDITVNLSYDTSTEDVKKAVLEVVNADKRILKDEAHKPFVRLSKYDTNNIEYTIRLWCDQTDYWAVYFDTLENMRGSFEKNGVMFSYPHTVVHMAENKNTDR